MRRAVCLGAAFESLSRAFQTVPLSCRWITGSKEVLALDPSALIGACEDFCWGKSCRYTFPGSFLFPSPSAHRIPYRFADRSMFVRSGVLITRKCSPCSCICRSGRIALSTLPNHRSYSLDRLPLLAEDPHVRNCWSLVFLVRGVLVLVSRANQTEIGSRRTGQAVTASGYAATFASAMAMNSGLGVAPAR